MPCRADPYSRLLSADGRRTLALPLSHHSCVPSPAWPADSFPPISSPTDAVIYELHVRDFSSRDSAALPSARGKYAAFTREVRRHVVILPSFGAMSSMRPFGAFDGNALLRD